MQRPIDKRAASAVLEATRAVLEYLLDWQRSLEETGGERPPWMAQTYCRVRRLREYLQRCMRLPGEAFDLDVGATDENLLVSCSVYQIGELDLQLASGESDPSGLPSEQRDFLDGMRRVLAHFATHMASAPVQRLPARSQAGRLTTPSVKAVMLEVQRRLSGAPPEDSGRTELGPAHSVGSGRPTPGTFGVPDRGAAGTSAGFYAPGGSGARHLPPGSGVHQAVSPAGSGIQQAEPPAAPVPSDRFAGQDALSPVPSDSFAAPPNAPPSPPPVGGGGASGVYSAVTPSRQSGAGSGAGALPAASASPSPAAGEAQELVDPQCLRDPRLRWIVTLDLRAFDRCRDAQDFRLSMVHLASILEAVLFDYALPRRVELGLPELPEQWRIEDLVARVFTTNFSPLDRNHALQILASHQLIRPIRQLAVPLVVTVQSLQMSVAFVRRLLAFLGYSGGSDVSAIGGREDPGDWLGIGGGGTPGDNPWRA